MTEDTPLNQFVLVSCPLCSAPVRNTLLINHLTSTCRGVEAGAAHQDVLMPCPACSASVKAMKLQRHLRERCAKAPHPPAELPQPPARQKQNPAPTARQAAATPARSPQSPPRPAPPASKAPPPDRPAAGLPRVSKPQRASVGTKKCPYCSCQIIEENYASHTATCRLRKQKPASGTANPKPAARTPAAATSYTSTDDKIRKTRDGYVIDHCWDCKRKICLVPVGMETVVFDIDWQHKKSTRHQCDGERVPYLEVDFTDIRAIMSIKRRNRK